MVDFPTIGGGMSIPSNYLHLPSFLEAEIISHKKQEKKPKKKTGGFQALGLSSQIYGGVVKLGYKFPTPIQKSVLPVALTGKDIVAMARTGSGKTAAFLIPLLERLGAHSSLMGARGLVISPTRELAQQTLSFALKLAKLTSLRMCLLQGGDRLEAQFEALQSNPDILLCTPGRISHLLLEMKQDFSLERIEVLIFDEADRLFEMGFTAQIELIIQKCPENRQTMLFSATLPKQLVEFANAGLRNPELVRLDADSSLSENLRLAFFKIRTEEKIPALLHLVGEVIPATDQTIIFVATRHHVEYLQRVFKLFLDIECSVVYSSLDQESRQDNINMFRKKKTSLLIVTDIAARGIDIPLLNNVINFNFPATKTVKLFVHRVGRAARQGRRGTAFSFVTSEEIPFLVDVCLYIGVKMQDYTKDADVSEVTRTKQYSLTDMTPNDIDFGTFPQEVLDAVSEKWNKFKRHDADLQGLERSVKNGYNLYRKTRESASRASVKRAKELNMNKIHPLFNDAKETEGSLFLKDFGARLKAYKPKETIFEMNEKKSRDSVGDAGNTSAIKRLRQNLDTLKELREKAAAMTPKSTSLNSVEIMQGKMPDSTEAVALTGVKRKVKAPLSKAERKKLKNGKSMEEIIKNRKSKEAGATKAKKDYKDEVGYITVDKAELRENDAFANTQIQSAQLDLVPDEEKAMQEKKRMHHWDKRKKKYVKATIEEHVAKKRIRNEAGGMVNPKSRGQFYDKWRKKTNSGLQQSENPQFESSETGEKVQRNVNVKHISRRMREKQNQEKQQRAGRKQLKGDSSQVITDEHQLRKTFAEKDKTRERNVKGHKSIAREKKAYKMKEALKKNMSMGKSKPTPSRSRYGRSRIVKR